MPKGVPNKRYTPEFKRMVVETMKKEHLSIYAAMQEFGINDHKIIERWERIYLEEGPEGLAIERRGRSSKGRPPKQLPKQMEEDLLAEVQRLRAENDYLKNLQALVLEDDRRQRRTCVVGTFPDGNSALMLVCARLRHVAGTQWGNKKYMNMKHLEAALEDVSIAG